MRKALLAIIPATLLLPACSIRLASGKSGGLEPFAPGQPYVRIQDANSNLVELQLAVRKFVPPHANGPAVWLAGVSHVGEPCYYAELQSRLNELTLVLFEGVGEHSPSASAPAVPLTAGTKAPLPVVADVSRRYLLQQESAPTNVGGYLTSGSGGETASPLAAAVPAARNGNMSSLQSTLAESLGLVFQLDAIDYSRPNFRNSDLSIADLRKLIAGQRTASGAAGASQSFEGLLQVMQGNGLFEILLEAGLRFIGSSPKLQGLSKLALIEALGQIQGDPAQLSGLTPELKQLLEVLIEQRDRKVISDLKTEAGKLRRRDSIAIFYGTGHMPDLERRLRQELGYRPAGQVWLTAFSVNLRQTGVSPGERQFIRGLVQREIAVKLQSPNSKLQ